MKRKYCEKLYEEMIKEYPKEFLGEELALVSQQPTYNGYRPDLIFKDANGIFVVVEIQLGKLDTNHLYRSLEYRQYIIDRHSVETARVVLVCNHLTDRHRKRVEVHNIRCIELNKNKFIANCKILIPGIKIIQKVDDNTGYISTNDIISRFSKNDKQGTKINLNAIVQWIFPVHTSQDDKIKYLTQNLTGIGEDAGSLFYSSIEDDICIKINNNIGDDIYITKQLIYSDILYLFTDEERSECRFLLHFIHMYYRSKRFIFDKNSFEIYLFSGNSSAFQDYMIGIKKEYDCFNNYYHVNKCEFDADKFCKYINLINSCYFYAGKYPNLEIVKLFGSIELSNVMPLRFKDKLEKTISKLPDELRQNGLNKASEGLWTTIKFNKFNNNVLKLLYDTNRTFSKSAAKGNNYLHIKYIDEEALLLSSKYFADLDLAEYE